MGWRDYYNQGNLSFDKNFEPVEVKMRQMRKRGETQSQSDIKETE